MILPPFELHRPRSIDALSTLIRELCADQQPFDFIAGGTDLLPNYKNRLNTKPHVISLAALEGHDAISLERIGALARIEDLARDSELAEHFPGITDAAKAVSSPPLRNLGTLGGNLLLDTRCSYFNQSEFWRASKGYCMKADGDVCLVVPQKEICYATFSGDLAPVFLVLDASFALVGADGERTLKAREFYEFDGIQRFVKKPDEALLQIDIPKTSRRLRTGYRKLRARDTIEYPVMGIAMGVVTENAHVSELHVAVTGAEAVPLYYGDLGLTDQPASEATSEAIAQELEARIKCYRNVPFPPGYRKAMGGELGRELFLDLVR